MPAGTKNKLLMCVVGFPLVMYFPIDSWQFWFIGMAAAEVFYLATLALPVFVDRVPRRDGR